MMRILAMGAGVNTTALLLKDQAYDLVVFSDTGVEKPETYAYIEEYLKPFCKERGLKWITVRNPKWRTLEDFIRHHNGPPDVVRRICTTDFKIRPIQRHMRDTYKVTHKKPYTVALGIGYDEASRANMSERTKYEKREFPLIDMKLTRRDCKDIIKAADWPIPPKSGCDFCPFQKKAQWRELSYKRPERFAELAEMEAGFKYGMTFSFSGKPLKQFIKGRQLDDFMQCQDGFCYV